MKPNNQKIRIAVLLVCLMALVQATLVSAQGTITIDGSFNDWAGQAAYVDSGGADDETSPARADITEFRASADSGGIYLLKAWDNTAFVGGNATTAGITVRNALGVYYRIYSTAAGNPATVLTSTLVINNCSDSTCTSQTGVCTGTGCTGAQAGSGTSWADPFAGRASPGCSGANCGTLDTAVELYLPWDLIGGAPGEGRVIFVQFGSYPSGPAQAPKDSLGPDGITCQNASGTFQCYVAPPSLVTLKHLQVSSSTTSTWPAAGVLVAVLLLTVAIWTGLRGLYHLGTKAG